MTRKTKRKDRQYTKPDHRPMVPELRCPEDTMDYAVRSVRMRLDELNPNDRLKWR